MLGGGEEKCPYLCIVVSTQPHQWCLLQYFVMGGGCSPLSPSIHENVTGGLLTQYFMAVIYTSQSSLHLKAEQPLWSPFLGWNEWNYSHWKPSWPCLLLQQEIAHLAQLLPASRGHCLFCSGLLIPACPSPKNNNKSFTTAVLWPGGHRLGWRARGEPVPVWSSTLHMPWSTNPQLPHSLLHSSWGWAQITSRGHRRLCPTQPSVK